MNFTAAQHIERWRPLLLMLALLYSHSSAQELPLLPTDSLQYEQPDSSALLDWSVAAEYDILKLRVQRWLTAHERGQSDPTYQNIHELLQESEEIAKLNDYLSARLLLESALELIEASFTDTSTPMTVTIASNFESEAPAVASRWNWRNEALVGIDLWRQEFEFNTFGDDSLLVDDAGNPYAGVRMGLRHRAGARSNFSSDFLLKSSRDYAYGDLRLGVQQYIGANSRFLLENRFETTQYRREFDLKYWQNNTRILIGPEISGKVRIELEDELRVRRYQQESSFYPNFFQNDFSLGSVLAAGISSRIQARYSYAMRRHGTHVINDFTEHRLYASISQYDNQNSSVYIENIWRKRIYPHGSDSTFQRTYLEEYLRADLRIGFTPVSALRFDGGLILRQYAIPSALTPDYLDARFNPQLEFKIHDFLQLSGGYLFLIRVHNVTRSSGVSITDAALVSNSQYLGYEDYFSHGLTLGLDVVNAKGFLVTLAETLEYRTYPNVGSARINGFDLYTNRKINSLLLFMSWNVTRHWQVGAVANYDNDRSRTGEASDSKTTLFSIDLSYSF